MGVSFAGRQAYLPDALREQCLEATPPLPLSPWYGVANRYACPVGLRPGYAYLLLAGGELNEIAPLPRHTLQFDVFPNGEPSTIVKMPNTRLAGVPVCVTPGVRSATGSTFLATIADRRIDCVGLAGKRYNWRTFPDAPYLTASLNSGVAWTWTTLLTDLWNAVGTLNNFPGLPRVPAGTPEQIDAMGCRAADILEDLLLVNDLGVAYDPVKDVFTIVDFATENPAFVAALGKYDDRRLWDQEPKLETRAPLPQYVRVLFPVWSPGMTPIDTATYFAVDVADTAAANAQRRNGFYAVIQDYQACRTNQIGTALNATDLATRAVDVAARWFQRARGRNFEPFYYIYTGLIDDPAMRPGASVDVLAYEDAGDGIKTHLVRTSRMGNAPLTRFAAPAPYTNGTLLTGHPMGTDFLREPVNGQPHFPIVRAGALAPDELRQYGTGPFQTASKMSATHLASGGGESSLLRHAGPLRQWDAAVEALAVDGHGQRLWKAKDRTQLMCFVKVTSTTPQTTSDGNYYPAIEEFIAPITLAKTTGDVCWYAEANGTAPSLNSHHLCYLDGTDGAVTPKKVYIDAGAGGSSLEVEEVDGSPSISPTSILQFDQADYFVVSEPTAGTARVDLTKTVMHVVTNVCNLTDSSGNPYMVVERTPISFVGEATGDPYCVIDPVDCCDDGTVEVDCCDPATYPDTLILTFIDPDNLLGCGFDGISVELTYLPTTSDQVVWAADVQVCDCDWTDPIHHLELELFNNTYPDPGQRCKYTVGVNASFDTFCYWLSDQEDWDCTRPLLLGPLGPIDFYGPFPTLTGQIHVIISEP